MIPMARNQATTKEIDGVVDTGEYEGKYFGRKGWGWHARIRTCLAPKDKGAKDAKGV